MEHRVAHAHDQRAEREHAGAMGRAHDRGAERHQPHAGHEHAASADAVYHEPGGRLQHGRGGEEQHHHEADGGVGDAQLFPDHREKRRQGELEKMAHGMRQPHYADDGCVVLHFNPSMNRVTACSVASG
jgi:hypothetical protein